jgi:organic radical activating enzyme
MPCCWFKPGVDANTYSEYQTRLSEIDIAAGCKHCIDQEAAGATWSHRMLFKDPNELVIGVCFDNICNIKCVTCTPYHSSQHIEEWQALGKYQEYNVDKKYFVHIMKQGPSKLSLIEDTIKNSTFDKIRLEIFGGEPLINPVVYKFIDWLVFNGYAKKTKLVLTTNGTTNLVDIKDKLAEFDKVTVQFSVDGTGEVFDFLRFGAKFDTMKDNVDYFKELGYEYGFNYTLSWMNVLAFTDFYNWALEHYPDAGTMHLTKLSGPKHYAVDLLPESIREHILSTLSLKEGSQQFQRIVNLYKESLQFSSPSNTALLNKGIAEIKRLTTLRNTTLTSIEPILDLIEQNIN